MRPSPPTSARIVFLGAMLADVPHTRPISIFASSENAAVRSRARHRALDLRGAGRHPERARRGRGGRRHPDRHDLGVGAPLRAQRAQPEGDAGPHRQARGARRRDDPARRRSSTRPPPGRRASTRSPPTTRRWPPYIQQLEQARDTVDSPEASGEAIAQEFERYLRRRGDGRDGQAGGPAPRLSPALRDAKRARDPRRSRQLDAHAICAEAAWRAQRRPDA